MSPRTWKWVLAMGAAAALIALPFGEVAQGVVMLLACIVSLGSVLVGVKHWRTEQREPWLWLAGSLAVLVATSVFRVAGVGLELKPLPAPDIAAVISYLMLATGFHRLCRLRAYDQDPTALVDALILTAAVGVLTW